MTNSPTFWHFKMEYTLHVHTASCGNGYTLYVGGKEYTLHLHRQLLMVLFCNMILKNHM